MKQTPNRGFRTRKPGAKKNPPRKGPLHQVRSGSVTVKIYAGTNRVKSSAGQAHEYPVFTVTYSETGKRRQHRYASLQDAKDAAGTIALRLNRGEHRVLQLTSSDADSYVHAMEQLKPLGVPLHSAVAEFVHAAKILDGRPLADAAKHYADRNRAKVTARDVADAVDELLVEREREGKSTRYLESVRSHLNRFKASVRVEIGSVTTLQMEAWLSKLGGAARTRNNVRCSLVTLFHFARKRGYLPRGVATEADEIARNAVPASVANIYSAADLHRLLTAADQRVLPAIAIGAFSGLRSASVARIRWENVKWEQGHLEIPAAIAKNRKRYLVPLLPCLAAWLAPYRGRKGAVIAGVRLEENLRELFKTAGVKRLHNGLRDSFISYRSAIVQNLPQVAYEAGNSVEMIRSKYLDARTKAEAEAWFAVVPSAPANVVTIGAIA